MCQVHNLPKRYTRESKPPTFRFCRIGDFKTIDLYEGDQDWRASKSDGFFANRKTFDEVGPPATNHYFTPQYGYPPSLTLQVWAFEHCTFLLVLLFVPLHHL